MSLRRTFAITATSLALAAVGTIGAVAEGPTIRIGSDNFYESKLMAEIYAQVLEGHGWTVDRLGGLGSRPERIPTFEAGQVDLVPEYVGSGLAYYITGSDDPALLALAKAPDGETARANLQKALTIKGVDATVLGLTPGIDINTAVVRPDTASELGLAKMSDLAAVQDQLIWGFPPECDANPLCKGALEAYGITFPPQQLVLLEACTVPLAQALENRAVDVAWLCSTQPAIAQYGFVALADDLAQQPVDQIAPIVRNAALAGAGTDAAALAAILDPVSAMITTEKLAEMGIKVAVDQQDLENVAAEFLATIQLPAASPAS